MAMSQLDLEQQCVTAFKQGNHDQAVQLLPQLQQPGDVTTEFKLSADQEEPNTNVTLLHIAAYHGLLDIVKTLKEFSSHSSKDNNGCVPLHYAAATNNLSVIDYLITEKGCEPTVATTRQNLPLHAACRYGHLNTTKYFIIEQNCDPNCRNRDGLTPLHFASQGGHTNVIQYLITEIGCDPMIPNNYGSLPLHIACLNGHLNAAQYFITEKKCDPNSRGQNGFTPLHYASQCGHMDIIQYLTSELCCDSRISDENGNLPLHIACANGHLNATKFFITEQKCDPNCRNKYGSAPLHRATKNGHIHIIQYFIAELGCDPSIVDNNNRSVLHLATYYGHRNIVQWLLRNNRVDIMAKDSDNKTCIDLARERRHFHMVLQLESFNRFSIHIFSKTVLTGNSGAGKTTLAKVIAELKKNYFNPGNIAKVGIHTTGIVPSLIKACETVVGGMVLYDLAGQAEYHSSHSAVMETVMQQSPATFINVVDLNNTDVEIVQQLHYWINFIDNVTRKTAIKSSLVVVGSHFGQLSHKELQSKSSILTTELQKISLQHEYMGFIAIDCSNIEPTATYEFLSLVYKSHQAIIARLPPMSYYCHVLYSFLKSKLDHSYCTLEEIISLLAHNDSLVPSEASFIAELLSTLSGRGLIIFLKNQQQLEKSWVVLDFESLLKKVNKVLALDEFEVSNTGIVRSSTLKQLFPQYNLEMLVGFIQTLELCHCVNLSGIENTFSFSNIEECSFFFPSFLPKFRPIIGPVSPYRKDATFGWCLYCKEETESHYFTSQFLHVLLLHLALSFSQASNAHFNRKCSMWTNGVCWDNEEGVRTAVELVDHKQCVMVVMSYKNRNVEYCKQRSEVIRLVLDLKQQLCSHLETAEYLTSCSFLRNWFSAESVCLPYKSDLLPIEYVANSMLHRRPFILASSDIISEFRTEDVLKSEPYYQLSPSSVCELMDSSKADEPVSQSLLHEVERICQVKQLIQPSHSHLRKIIDEMSIYAGKSPIVS